MFDAFPSTAQFAQRPNPLQRIWLFLFSGARSQKIGTARGNVRGARGRDRCEPITYPLTAIVQPVSQGNLPATREELTYIEPVTSSRPTFWFYIPYTTVSSEPVEKRVEFVLQNEAGQRVYENRFYLPKQSGVLGLQLPQTISLREGQSYRWVLSVMCDLAARSGDATIRGWVEYVTVDPDINRQLEMVADDSKAKIRIYAEQGYWYDTINLLARSIKANNQKDTELQATWTELLRMLNLPLDAPIIEVN